MTYCKSIRGGAPSVPGAPINPEQRRLYDVLSRMLNNVLNKLITIKIFIAIKKSLFAEDTTACDADCETDIKKIFKIEGVNIEEIRKYSEEAMDEFQGLDDIFQALDNILGLSAEQAPVDPRPQELELTSLVKQQLSHLTDLLQSSHSSRDMFSQAYDKILEIEQNILKFNQTAKILNPLNPFEQNNLFSLYTTTFDIIQQVIKPYIQFLRQKRNAERLSKFYLSIAEEDAKDPSVSSRQRQLLRARRDRRAIQEKMGLPESSLNPYIPPGFELPPGEFADLLDDSFYDKESMIYELNYPEKSKVYKLNYSEKRKAGKSRKINNFMRMVKPHKTHKQYKKHKKTKRNNKKQSLRRRRNTLNAR